MAKDKIQNGQAEYGVIHVMEEEMRANEQGVFEPKSGEAARKPARKSADASPETKMEAAPANKSIISANSVKAPASRARKSK